MKRLSTLIAVVLLASSCSKSLEGDGDIVDQSYTLDGYHEINTISIESGFTLIFCDDVEAGVVEISTYENIMEHVSLKNSGSKLSLGLDSGNYEGDLQLYARMNGSSRINIFEASGGSIFNVESDISLTDTSVVLSGGSYFYGYRITSDKTQIYLSGGSTMEITAMGSITGSCSGGSYIYYQGSASVDVDSSGGSVVTKYDGSSVMRK